MTDHNDSENATALPDDFDQALEAFQGLVVKVVGFVDEQCDWLFALFYQLLQSSLTAFALARNRNRSTNYTLAQAACNLAS